MKVGRSLWGSLRGSTVGAVVVVCAVMAKHKKKRKNIPFITDLVFFLFLLLEFSFPLRSGLVFLV